MKRLGIIVVIAGWILFGTLRTQTAYAGVLDWPVVNQVSNVVKCVISDVGKITNSLVNHATAFTTETLQTVGQCLLYTTGQVTGTSDPNPLHEEPHA